MRLTTSDVRRIRELRYMDGLTSLETAQRIGCSESTIKRYAPGRPGKVSNEPLREAFKQSGLTAAEVARRVGWWWGVNPDASRVYRTLGLRPDIQSAGRRSTRAMIDAETASAIAEAIGVAPWEVIPDAA